MELLRSINAMKTVYACEQVRKRFTLLGHMKAWENS